MLNCLIDAGSFDEYKAEYGQTLVCGTARLGGFPVGIVANQRHRIKTARGEYQFGGVIYVDSAEKAARFVMNCNQDWLPLLFLQDVNGFMVGRDSERAGIIKAGAKLVSAVSNSRVPKITLLTGGSYGAGNYALCGKAFDPRFIFAWPTARCAVMGPGQATNTLLDVMVASLKKQGQQIDAAELEQLRREAAALREQLEQAVGANSGLRSARDVHQLEARIDSLAARNAKLMDTLKEARQQLLALREEVDRLGQPPSGYGVLLGTHDDDTVDVFTSGR
jgi:acetyl-CoA carboxylase carboxyltransferase component